MRNIAFELSESQSMRVIAWKNAMKRCFPAYSGAIGGRFTYSITPTSLGTVVKIQDFTSGLFLDVTDYENW